jgi:hypothetical protein
MFCLVPDFNLATGGSDKLLLDDNFLRLVVPAYNYERLITHDLKACSQIAWVH